MTEARKPLDAALDLFVFVPVGLAMTAAEELPKLAAKGRSRVTTQLTMARVVGQFAVSKGRSMIEERLERVSAPNPPAEPPGGPANHTDVSYDEFLGQEAPAPRGPTHDDPASGRLAAGLPGTEAPVPDGSAGGRMNGAPPLSAGLTGVTVAGSGDGERRRPASKPGGSGPAGPSPAALAIPGYDSLSASQVVQRLAGLSGDELAAVRSYEEAHRGRRTILNRVNQLQGP